jgi:hypothetical protein
MYMSYSASPVFSGKKDTLCAEALGAKEEEPDGETSELRTASSYIGGNETCASTKIDDTLRSDDASMGRGYGLPS